MEARKDWLKISKRHQMQHLEFSLLLVRDYGLVGRIPTAPDILSISEVQTLLGAELKIMQELLRHSTIGVTLDTGRISCLIDDPEARLSREHHRLQCGYAHLTDTRR